MPTDTATIAPTAQVGNLSIYKTSPTRYVLTTATGAIVGVYPTAREARAVAIARITAAHNA